MPLEKSGGVENAFPSATCPAWSRTTQSVNVPPMSTPITYFIVPRRLPGDTVPRTRGPTSPLPADYKARRLPSGMPDHHVHVERLHDLLAHGQVEIGAQAGRAELARELRQLHRRH